MVAVAIERTQCRSYIGFVVTVGNDTGTGTSKIGRVVFVIFLTSHQAYVVIFVERMVPVDDIIISKSRCTHVFLLHSTGQWFFAVSGIVVKMCEAAVVVDVERHFVAQSFKGSDLQITAYRSRIALVFFFVVQHGLREVITVVRTFAVVSVIVNTVAIFIQQIFAGGQVTFIHRIKRRNTAGGQYDVSDSRIVLFRIILNRVGSRYVQSYLQPFAQVGRDIGTEVITLEARTDVSTLVVQVAQREIILGTFATTRDAGTDISIMGILA